MILKNFPTDLKNILVNQSKYSFLMNENGGIYDDLIITKLINGFNIVLNAACKNTDFELLKLLKNKYEMEMKDNFSLIAIQGPEAVKILEKIINGVSKLNFMNGNKLIILIILFILQDQVIQVRMDLKFLKKRITQRNLLKN